MKFKDLSFKDKADIIAEYQSSKNRKQIQEELSEKFDVARRTIRKWANKLGVGLMKNSLVNRSTTGEAKILIYDIETSRATAKVWWSGKQFVNGNQIVEDPKIISIAWKWLGDDKVSYLTWDENHSDEEMLIEFLDAYNSADMVVGQNNDKFDNRWINARAMFYGLNVNMFVKSFDIQKQTKKLFRLPSYSMAYITKFLGVSEKMKHEGIIMWEMIEDGNKAEQKEYLQKMVDYNVQDIISTEDMYLTLRKYMGHKVHFGVLDGKERYTCPNCGGLDLNHYRTTTTPAGTIQHIMVCNHDKVQFKLSNREYLRFKEL